MGARTPHSITRCCVRSWTVTATKSHAWAATSEPAKAATTQRPTGRARSKSQAVPMPPATAKYASSAQAGKYHGARVVIVR